MSTVTTAKPINAPQLADELGGIVIKVTADGTVTADVPLATLQAAVDAHVAVDEDGNRRTLEEQALAAMDKNRDDIAVNDAYAALANPTNAQIAAHVKVLNAQSTRHARQLNGVARLILGRLDATD